MADSHHDGLHVVVVGVDLDPLGRFPAELLSVWRDFGRAEAVAAEDPGVRLTIVQSSWRDDLREIEGITCHFVREPEPVVRLFGGRVLRRLPRRLLSRVGELVPDVVHVNGLGFPRELRAMRTVLPEAVIIARAHGVKLPEGWRRWYHRWGFAVLDAVIFCARAQAEPFKQNGILRENLPVFEVIEISTPFTPGDRFEARATTRLEGDPCLFWLGNLDANKDPMMVLDAVAAATLELPKLRFYMCFRNANLIDQVRGRIAADPALVDRVTLLGEIAYPGIETYLRAADFLVQGSHREAGGCGVVEALACGATPLVTDIPSFRRITGGGTFGALVPVGGAAALAREIVNWSRRDRPVLRQAAREHFERDLSIRAVGRQLRETYQQARRLR